MTTRFNCTLNGASLAEMDESIVILDITEDAPLMHTAALPLHGGGRREEWRPHGFHPWHGGP